MSMVPQRRVDTPSRADELRAQILELTREYHDEAFPTRHFVGGESPVPVAGRVFDADELELGRQHSRILRGGAGRSVPCRRCLNAKPRYPASRARVTKAGSLRRRSGPRSGGLPTDRIPAVELPGTDPWG